MFSAWQVLVSKSTAMYSAFIGLFLCLLTSNVAQAHEVYVLQPDQITDLEGQPPVAFLDILARHTNETILWTAMIGAVILAVFFVSISPRLEQRYDGFLIKLKHYAPFIARVTAGLALVASGYYGALFGPELPFVDMVGDTGALVLQGIFIALGALILLGLYPRLVALACLGFFAVGVWFYGSYMLTYTNYLGEFLVLLLVGSHRVALEHRHGWFAGLRRFLEKLSTRCGEYAFFLLRIGFGISLIYSAVYAKIWHNQLAIEVVHAYDLQSIFIFTPEFIVFGAALVEILLGVFFILGLEIRFTAVVLNIFLTLSLIYFGEAVWPHIILIGVPIAFFCYGYDKYSLEGYFFKKGNREPIF